MTTLHWNPGTTVIYGEQHKPPLTAVYIATQTPNNTVQALRLKIVLAGNHPQPRNTIKNDPHTTKTNQHP